MSEISLAVTKAVLEYTKPGRDNERQIAYTSPSPDIAQRLAEIRTRKQANLRLGDRLVLVVGDTGAIWRAHNEEHAGDFDALFEFLSRFPSKPMRFLCELFE